MKQWRKPATEKNVVGMSIADRKAVKVMLAHDKLRKPLRTEEELLAQAKSDGQQLQQVLANTLMGA